MRRPRRGHAWAIALALLLLGGSAAGAPARLHLANGIEVVLAPDPGCGEIAVVVWVPIGGRDDVAPRTGMAHLFEHLMFTGSAQVPEGEHDRLVEEAGGWSNATTSPDATVYTTVATAGALERVLVLEADRFAGLTLGERTLATQKEIVASERRQRQETSPYGAASPLLSAALWPADHPYHDTPLGQPADVAAVTLAEARAYFDRAYAPDGLVVVIAGDLDPATVAPLVERTFGALPARERPPRRPPPIPPPLRAVTVQADDAVQATRLYLAWRTPAWYGASDTPLAVTAMLLGGGRASRLWRRLVVEAPLADDLQAVYLEGEWAGVFQIVVTVRPGVEPQAVVAAIDRELAALATIGPTRAELVRARNQHEAGALEQAQSLPARTLQIARWLVATGEPDRLALELAQVRTVSATRIRDVVARFLAPRARVHLLIGPP